MLLRFVGLLSCLFCLVSCQKNEEANSSKVVRISSNDDIPSIDPRRARSLASVNAVHFLFEGLTRKATDGSIECAACDNFQVSDDKTLYTFHLKKLFWSDGTPLSAHDFAYSWKMTLDPTFKTANAHELFVIQHGKDCWEKKLPAEQLGIRVIDEQTLEVKLEKPLSYFPELLTCHFFYPVSKKWFSTHPEAKELSFDKPPSNGPFKMKSHRTGEGIVLEKNRHYWDKESFHIDSVAIVVAEDSTALCLFEKGELDWTGSPISTLPPDAVAHLKEQKKINFCPCAGTSFIRVNCTKAILPQQVRKAFFYAIDRQGIVEHVLHGDHLVAQKFIPPCMLPNVSCEQGQIPQASALFEKALGDLNLEKGAFANLSLIFIPCDVTQKMAQVVQQNFKDAFNIDLKVEACESKIFYERIQKLNYDLALGSWVADFNDPINFLNVFKEKNNGTNNTGWENEPYKALLERSSYISDREERNQLLANGEKIIMEEYPILPIYHYTFKYLQQGRVKGMRLSSFGTIELRGAVLLQQKTTGT